MVNEILLRRKNKILFSQVGGNYGDETAYVTTIQKNIESLGYVFSEGLFNALKERTREDLGKFYLELIPMLKNKRGADVVYRPMYPNFPDQVMQMSEVELYLNAIVHYWSEGMLVPETEVKERLPLFEGREPEILGLGTQEDLKDLFKNLVNSRTSLSQTDKEDLIWFFTNERYMSGANLPEVIPYKENVCLICKLQWEAGDNLAAYKYLKTPTDVLRLAVALSGGDISLAENTKFRSFKRWERRTILHLLEKMRDIESDMKKYSGMWIRLGERLHPSEKRHAELYPKANNAFVALRENEQIVTFNSRVDRMINAKSWMNLINLLKTRPGEFARRLDLVMRSSGMCKEAVGAFNEIADQVSTPVLLQVREHFLNRNSEYRVFFPKGNLARSYNIPNELPTIEDKYCNMIIKICERALINQYSHKEFLGNVYVSEALRGYTVPFSQRSASKAMKAVSRGSRIAIREDTKVVRSFIWWTNLKEGEDWYDRIDIDLSAEAFTDDWEYLAHVSYTNLKDEGVKAYHSGDIVNGGPVDGSGVAEFIDFDIESVLKAGGRYVVFQVYSYSQVSFDKMPHAMFGWMERRDCHSGEIFEPSTVEQRMDLASKSTVCVPVIFDCLTREYIWCDMNLNISAVSYCNGGNNLESNLNSVLATCYSMTKMKKTNLYDLIQLHIQARGVQVETKEEADIIFDISDGITPYDVDVFMGEYL